MHKNQKKNVVTLMNYISTAGGIQDVRVLLTSTGSTVTSMTEDVRITMDVLTMAALKTRSHSLNGLIALKAMMLAGRM